MKRFVSHSRIVPGAVLGGLLVVLLAGCTPEANVYGKVDRNDPTFLFCQEFHGSDLIVRVSPRGELDYEEVWRLSGDVDIDSADTIRIGDVLPGTTQTVPPDLVLDDMDVEISLIDRVGSKESVEFVATFAAGVLSSSYWSSQTSKLSEAPC